MKTITSAFVAFGLVASLAVAGEGEGCPTQCKASAGKATELAAASVRVIEQAEESLRLANARYLAGTATQLDVLATRIDSEYNVKVAFETAPLVAAAKLVVAR